MNYIELFKDGNLVSISKNNTVEVKDKDGNPTGGGFVKDNLFQMLDLLSKKLKEGYNLYKLYNEVEKNLPKINESPTVIPHIGLANLFKLTFSNDKSYNTKRELYLHYLSTSTNL